MYLEVQNCRNEKMQDFEDNSQVLDSFKKIIIF